jgi:DNA-binding MarR family transcriptional regulator
MSGLLPALLRSARRVYGTAIREALAAAGCGDVPRNGLFVIGAIARTGAPLSEVIDQLGVSKQAAGQLVDTLVMRGYLERTVDPDDRRRLRVALTERGASAASVIRAAVEQNRRRAYRPRERRVCGAHARDLGVTDRWSRRACVRESRRRRRSASPRTAWRVSVCRRRSGTPRRTSTWHATLPTRFSSQGVSASRGIYVPERRSSIG